MMRSTTVQDGLQVLLVLVCGSALVGAGRVLGKAGSLSTSPRLEQLLGTGLSVVGVLIVAVWMATLGIALVAAVLQRAGRPSTARVAARVAAICTPAVMRRLAMALVGVNLLTMPAVALASPGSVQVIAQQQSLGSSAAPGAARSSATGSTSGDAEPAPGGAVSPYWMVEPVPETIEPRAAPDSDGAAPPGSDPDGQTGPASASATADAPPTPAPAPRATSVSPGWTPMPMPVDGGLMLRQELRATAGPSEVAVAPGDSLWSIVADQLGPSASAAEVARAWPAWFEANRSTIGDDPALLIPGQILRSP